MKRVGVIATLIVVAVLGAVAILPKSCESDDRGGLALPTSNAAEFELIRSRVAAKVSPTAIAVIPEHIPRSAKNVRIWCSTSDMAMLLYCELPPSEAMKLAADARARAVYTSRYWQVQGSQPHDDSGQPIRTSPWTREGLERLVGLPIPAICETIVLKNTDRGYGLGGKPQGESHGMVVDESTGVVIWSMMFYSSD